MNKTEVTIEGVAEAIEFISAMWLTNEYRWSGDLSEFMANVIDERVNLYDVIFLLKTISKGQPISGLENISVRTGSNGKIEQVQVFK